MPIYEYKCKQCAERFEIEQRITDDALTSLEGCADADDGMHVLKKVFSSVGISFKGDGFYRNDSRSSRSSSSSSSGSSASSESTTSSTDSSSTSSNGGSSSSGDASPAKAATSSD